MTVFHIAEGSAVGTKGRQTSIELLSGVIVGVTMLCYYSETVICIL